MPDHPTFTFYYGDARPDRRTAVFQALGGASSCWDHLEGAGVFESDRALSIGEALLAELGRLDEPLLGLATTRELAEELRARLDVHRAHVSVGGIEHEGHPERPVREAAGAAHAALALLLGIAEPRVLEYRPVNPEENR